MKLTARQDKFARLVAEGKTLSDAYRGAYTTENMKMATINRRATETAQIGKISARIDELKAKFTEKSDFLSTITVERQAKLIQQVIQSVMRKEQRARDRGEEVEHTDWSVFLKAVEKQNDLLGLEAPKKSEMKITNAAKIVISPKGEKPGIENGD